MQFLIFTLIAAVAVVAAPAGGNSAREQFKEQNCLSQACIDAVDSGCPLNNINFTFGCDENGFGQ